MRRAAKIDTTQNAIVDALLAAGCKVQSLAQVGCGVPDLLVMTPDRVLWLLEAKSPGGSLTPAQVKWQGWWGGVLVVQTPEDALTGLGLRGE
jgi:hypothetical protein